MQPEQTTDRVTTPTAPTVSVSKQLLLATDPKIRQIRKILVVIYGIGLVVCMFGLIDAIFSRTIEYCLIPNGYYQEIGEYIIAILSCAIGLFVTFRYSVTGLLVVAWISIIELVGIGIAILFLICTDFTDRHVQNSITKYSVANQKNHGRAIIKHMGSFMCTIVYIIAFVFGVIIVKLPFKLAKLIGAKKTTAIQQIQRTV
ncbi:unnamed protein product [Rotaria sordida]|uniref:Uncharacterized protein n=1 Tax=Rotaria sordida TaxID=392033 RepID=A0A814H8N5_9BILA|nr:unnamed protein product [Rotaria sordida]CAF1575892.1 unnamed protein product [Rotaria sordida]